MDATTARWVILGVLAGGVVVWLFGLRAFALLFRGPAAVERRATVPIDAATLRQTLRQAALAQHATVENEGEGRMALNLAFGRLTVQWRPEGAGLGLVATADVRGAARVFALLTGVLVLVLAPAVLAGLSAVLLIYIVPAGSDQLRWQSLQILQIVHVLWPPFLLQYLAGKYHRVAETCTDNLVGLLRETPGKA